MASPTLAPRGPRTRRILLRVLLGVLLVAGLALAGTGLWFYAVATSSLAQLDGTVQLKGLSAPVTIRRDQHGVPHIIAATPDDLFFAQGFVTAQDRLWQMDINRRFAAGELSEAFGANFFGTDMLKVDKAQRTLQLRRVAERALAALPPRERGHLEAYTRGVNAAMAIQRAHLPIEFRMLGYQPKPWTAEDSMIAVMNIVQALNHGFYADELAREKVAAKVPPELLKDLYPNTSWRDHPPTAKSRRISPDDQNPDDEDDMDDDSAVTRLRHWRDLLPLPHGTGEEERFVPGSNNWVVSGAFTVTGKPLLANDMHLEHHIPNVWYEAHLELSQPVDGQAFNAVGVTLPGFPYVIAGHNQRIAWGYTNLGPDVEDVYIENFNAAGDYQTPQGWQQPEHRREVIKVKGAPDVVLDVVVTRHGPIITDIVPGGETRKLALHWQIYDEKLPPALVYWEIDTATNWAEFRNAWSHHVTPSLNVVYADVDGHIGYQATGAIPIRNGWDGNLPVSGADGAHEWAGYIPFEDLPQVLDPGTGVLATANARVSPDGFKYVMSNQWFPPYRQERIYRMLQSGRKFAAADMLPLQMDAYSDYDRFTAERIVYAVDHSRQPSERAKKAAEILRSWDGRVVPETPAPVLTTMTRKYLWQLLLEPYMGPPDKVASNGRPNRVVSGVYKEYSWGMQSVAMENLLLRQPQRWLPKSYANWDELITAALEKAVGDKDAPANLEKWTYGRQAPMYLQHPLFGAVPVLSHWSGPGVVPQAGNSFTVKQAGRGFGASERFTVDLADLDNSSSDIVTGQSGQIFSPYYMDQWSAWSEGTAIPLPFTDAAVQKATTHTLVLQPAK
jgi:penicillin amidase